jgi:3-mercaptopyruvate sulfurtransferase SseA
MAAGSAQRWRIPALARPDGQIIVMCSEGFASALAAASLRRFGLHRATYVDGGFQAWKAAGLPQSFSAKCTGPTRPLTSARTPRCPT